MKEAILGNIATSLHSPLLASGKRTVFKNQHVAENIIPPAFQRLNRKPLNCNIERWQTMEAWKIGNF
jgi:hypothetical protein